MPLHLSINRERVNKNIPGLGTQLRIICVIGGVLIGIANLPSFYDALGHKTVEVASNLGPPRGSVSNMHRDEAWIEERGGANE